MVLRHIPDIYFIVPEGKFVVDTVHSVALQDSKKRQFTAKKENTNRYCTLSIWPYILHTPWNT